HNYGPDRLIGSVHIEVPDTYSVEKLDALEREIVQKVYETHQVMLAGISVYSMNTKNDKAAEIRNEIRRIVMSHAHVLQMHGFYVNETEKQIHFDVIIDFAAPDRVGTYQEIVREVQERYPEYHMSVALDADISD
ncbi:MAG: cation transporter, partial [Lachnospiraceae bacterium]|nr:cation transporter [Lachnospiraceae bacterium]